MLLEISFPAPADALTRSNNSQDEMDCVTGSHGASVRGHTHAHLPFIQSILSLIEINWSKSEERTSDQYEPARSFPLSPLIFSFRFHPSIHPSPTHAPPPFPFLHTFPPVAIVTRQNDGGGAAARCIVFSCDRVRTKRAC